MNSVYNNSRAYLNENLQTFRILLGINGDPIRDDNYRGQSNNSK